MIYGATGLGYPFHCLSNHDGPKAAWEGVVRSMPTVIHKLSSGTCDRSGLRRLCRAQVSGITAQGLMPHEVASFHGVMILESEAHQ